MFAWRVPVKSTCLSVIACPQFPFLQVGQCPFRNCVHAVPHSPLPAEPAGLPSTGVVRASLELSSEAGWQERALKTGGLVPWPQIIIHDYNVSPNHMGPQFPNTERGWLHPSSEMGPHECPGQALRRERKMCEAPGKGGRVRFWRPWCPGGHSLSLPSRGSSWESSPEARLSPGVQAPGFPLCLLLP